MNENETPGGVLVTPPPKLSGHLDWLEITYPILRGLPSDMYPDHWSKKSVETKPVNGYSVAARYDDGRVEMINPDQKSMGVHVQMSAKVLAALKEDDLWLLNYFLENGARVTRLDCALDVFNKPLDFDVLWSLAKSGEFECRLRKDPVRTHETQRGDTIYFGRMKSSVFTRIYDKAAEQNVSGDWTRVETVFRHARANNAAKLMVKRSLSTQQMIAGHVNFPRLQWWADVMTQEPVKTRLDRHEGDKRMEWLMRSVAPTLAKEIFLRGDNAYDEFCARVLDELNKLKEKSFAQA